MIEINEQRFSRRILAVCRALDLDGKFLGFTLDLTKEGIHLILNNTFPDDDKFSIILTQNREDKNEKPDITLEIEKAWRKSTNEEYDEVGGKIIDVDLQAELDDLILYCDNYTKKKYDFDGSVNL